VRAVPTQTAATDPAQRPPWVLQPGGVLLHIGPHKTGTTAVQGALHTQREQLAQLSIHYPGPHRQVRAAAMALSGALPLPGQPRVPAARWDRLVAEVARARRTQRVVVSSEFFADCRDDAIRRAVDELGPVHIVVTLRPLASVMISQWQQYVQNGLQARVEDWFDGMLRRPPYRSPTPSFWRRHRHGELVTRWAAVAGAESVTVVVLDDDRSTVMRRFDELTGLPPGTLTPERDCPVNRSLTHGEAELLRLLNEQFTVRDWRLLYAPVLRYAAVRRILREVTPRPEEQRITAPPWAVAAASEQGRRAAAAISELGVDVRGDLSALAAVPTSLGTPVPAHASVPARTAAHALIGAVVGLGADHPGFWEDVPRRRRVPDRRLLARARHELLLRTGR
jgi:hypothetical protein